MISVAEAQAHLARLVRPLDTEGVALEHAAGRVLAQACRATRDQPPFAASSMDGYAVKRVEADRDAQFHVIGEAAAGHRFDGIVGPGQAVRIFTGAPLPEGADFVIIQEDIARSGDVITVREPQADASNIRAQGCDFAIDHELSAPRRLGPSDIALLAAMNIPHVTVTRRPRVALISTGDELVFPGQTPGPDQIIASNTFGLKALLTDLGADVRILPIARDTRASLRMAFELTGDADLIVTIGGASVGDHDLVADAAEAFGISRAFYKVAMRPGKPLMAGTLDQTAMVGLPGNPVSAMVCGHVFIVPMIRAMLGLGHSAPAPLTAPLAAPIGRNGPRARYMRAVLADGALTAFDSQDSALLSVLAKANALLIRPPNDPERPIGDPMPYLVM